MLNLETLKEFTNKSQTNIKNIVREYIQHLFLSSLYKSPDSEKLLFKGGTSLRIIYNSPRFSEDLDFSGYNIHRHKIIDDLFIGAISTMEKMGIDINFNEAKPTTGGYLGIISYQLHDISENMKFEVSLRSVKPLSYQTTTIVNDYSPAYVLAHLPAEEIVKEKIKAFLFRKKPRDYYDLYFLLRHPELNKCVKKAQLKDVLKNLEKEKMSFKIEDLSVLLPHSHAMILKDFKKNLKREIKKYL